MSSRGSPTKKPNSCTTPRTRGRSAGRTRSKRRGSRSSVGQPPSRKRLMISDLFPFLTADGATQVADDEALLESAAATGRPALRFYTWDPPTLSLGYFQPFADRLPGLPVVRRMTGGGAIVHHHELTYAL